ncbi:hypothetical protein E1A91_D02G114600v1 [Gossypium mustelinum]|uniref:Uncharacterized protein n=6 Tax=Gossypium TaxID=3633 RepID=A0A5D2VVL0_GOSMU|nr:hypothetical protein ES319_D02G109200v1 [Gossypium barbadense]MBA0635415.1 hypothetical protein [Gossypium davidsonii]MBA0648159.1 hypothetical protein [Gossypium klotzschianum]TYG79132.1 hypothetical protein ES288_D02G117000v1 [Gossypium darwinii]TYH83282.1 hypothetical protein ES332_D02G121900v1 [Gossypium tomentosum]TYI93090.1 hypothetical protein E1A91_D02G114600v1 [Gossypium mustelinum]
MSGRIFVVIFFSWTALTIITPTLVLWSESSKHNFEFNLKGTEGIKGHRKIIGYGEKQVGNGTISVSRLEAATEQQKWSCLLEFGGWVIKVLRKAMGFLSGSD